MNLLNQYIIALASLYGQVTAKKVLEIYNSQNEDQIGIDDVEVYLNEDMSKQYDDLFKYVKKNFSPRDSEKAQMLCDNIRWECLEGPNVQEIFDLFNTTEIKFKDEKQVKELLQLVMELSNNVRLWENNGYTANEISEILKKFSKSK